MKCECGSDVRTKDSRKIDRGVWRLRFCPACGAEFTTLEQRCETVRAPQPVKKGAPRDNGEVIAPPLPAVAKPNPPNKRARALRADPKPAEKPGRKPLLKEKAEMRRAPAPVDRLEPTARDRIEDLKFERESRDYGWE